jgi:hypothetical protein
MPCESAAAGLVALGALRKRLELAGADDRSAHFQRMRSLALDGRSGVEVFDLRSKGKKRGPYIFDGHYGSDMVWVRLRASPDVRVTVSPSTACFWQFAGEPPIQILDGRRLHNDDFYVGLPAQAGRIVTENLSHSDSAICLAGRALGEAASRTSLDELRFRTSGGAVASLADLLTIHSWQRAAVSRVVFYNTRIKQPDRACADPRLVVADGEQALLGALERFSHSDVVGVVSRVSDRERLEMIGARMAGLAQWFEADEEFARCLPPVPLGIVMSVVKER